MTGPSDREEIVRLTVTLETLVVEVRKLSQKVESLKDEHMAEAEQGLAVLEERVQNDITRLAQLESQMVWTVRAVITEGLALVSSIVYWIIQNYA